MVELNFGGELSLKLERHLEIENEYGTSHMPSLV